MQSATPHHPHNRHNINAESASPMNGGRRIRPTTPSTLRGPRPFVAASEAERQTRMRAGLAYAIPFVPALVLLVRERRHRWIRFHAAQSLVFFTLLALVQIALFAALVLLGGIIESLSAAALVGLAFYGVYLLVGIAGLLLWLRLIADAMSGRSTRLRPLSDWAMRLEEALARLQRVLPSQQPTRSV